MIAGYYKNLVWIVLLVTITATSLLFTSSMGLDSEKHDSSDSTVSWNPLTTSITWKGMPNFKHPLRVYPEGNAITFVTYAGDQEVHLDQSVEQYEKVLSRLRGLVPRALAEAHNQAPLIRGQYTLVVNSAGRETRVEFGMPESKAQREIILLLNEQFVNWGNAGFGTPSPSK